MSVMNANAEISSYELTEENLRKLARRNQRPLKCKFCFRNFKYRQVIVHHLQEEHSDLIRKILRFKIDQGKKVKMGSKDGKEGKGQKTIVLKHGNACMRMQEACVVKGYL